MPSDDDISPGPGHVRTAARELPGRDEVDDFQHARIVSAMIEVAAELGYLGAAVAPVVARAGVSRRTFYELFDGREDCFLAAFEWGVGQARTVTVDAYRSQRAWREGVRHALAALLGFLDSEPQLARVCLIEALGAGKLVLRRRAEIVEQVVAALDADAPRPRGVADRPLLTAEGIVGGAFSVIHGRLLEAQLADPARASAGGRELAVSSEPGEQAGHDQPQPGRQCRSGAERASALMGLHGQLMALIVLPYLGPRAAGEEFTRPAPELPRRKVVDAQGDGGRLLERLDMRLTYRTVRALVFVAEHPGASNREIARGAEIADEGQASKLLGRLTRLGLVANARPPGPGFPNRWTLTTHGEQVLGAVRGR